MTDKDDLIAAALDDDDKAFLASLESERGLFQQIGDSWKGPLGNWAKFAFAMAVVFGVILIAVFWQVAHTSHPVVHTLWAITGVAVLIMLGFLKMWIFNRMNMLTILREVKRLQVQVAMLSDALNEKRD